MGRNHHKSILEIRKDGPFSEAFDNLMINLAMSSLDTPAKSILVTSSVPGEGKTLSAINLAINIAATGKKVLLVDLDLLKPSVHKWFNLNGTFGLVDALVGMTSVTIDSGKLGDYTIGDIFYFLEAQGRSGVITFESNGMAVEVTVKSGNIVNANLKNRPVERSLGRIFLHYGRVTPNQLKEALGIRERTKKPLSQLLVSLGFVSKQEIKKAVRALMEESLRRLFLMENPTFRITDLDGAHFEEYAEEASREQGFFREFTRLNTAPFFNRVVVTAVKHTPVQNLYVCPCGKIPPNPVEIMGSKRMHEFLKIVTGSFDMVVFDSSPVLGAAHVSLSPSLVDGVLLVVRAGKTGKKIVIEAKRQLEISNARLLGVVLNGVDRRLHYRRYYRYYARSEQVDTLEPSPRKLIPLFRKDPNPVSEKS
jgi:Mrp family chromosome partitioning ATPase